MKIRTLRPASGIRHWSPKRPRIAEMELLEFVPVVVAHIPISFQQHDRACRRESKRVRRPSWSGYRSRCRRRPIRMSHGRLRACSRERIPKPTMTNNVRAVTSLSDAGVPNLGIRPKISAVMLGDSDCPNRICRRSKRSQAQLRSPTSDGRIRHATILASPHAPASSSTEN